MFKIIALLCLYNCAFATSPITDFEKVEEYIGRLRQALPALPADCFVNVIPNGIRETGEIKIVHPIYYFVNMEHVAECSKDSLTSELRPGTHGVLKEILGMWMKQQRLFSFCAGDCSKEINWHRYIASQAKLGMTLYAHKPFLNALNWNEAEDPVPVAAPIPARAVGLRADSDSRDPRGDAARQRALRVLEARRAAAKPAITEVPAEPVAGPMTAAKAKRNRHKNRGLKDEGVAALASVSAVASSTTAEADPSSSFFKGLTPQQTAEMDAHYAGRGLSYEGKFEQACADGFFATLLRSTTPSRAVSRSSSKPKRNSDSDVSAASAATTTSSSSRSATPSRIRSMRVEFESRGVKALYDEYLSKPCNESAKSKFLEFRGAVQKEGLASVVRRAKPFRSVEGAYKLDLSGGGRVTFKRGEDDSIIIIGDPAHYGD